MKAIGIVAGLGVLSLLAIGAKRRGLPALAKACHGLMAGKMQEHCGDRAGGVSSCCAAPAAKAQEDPGGAGQAEACTDACAEG